MPHRCGRRRQRWSETSHHSDPSLRAQRSNPYVVCASTMLAGVVLLSFNGGARAQTVFTTIQAFGDSYADTGNLIKAIGPIKIAGIDIYPTGRFSGGTNFVDTTSALLGIPQNNFAIGGATTGNGITNFRSEERRVGKECRSRWSAYH